MARILNVITAVSPIGGTITKLRALMKSSRHEHYLYHPGYNSNKDTIAQEIQFYKKIGVEAFYGIHNRNIIAHVKEINKIINQYEIDVVHFYFNFEHLFAPLLKIIAPHHLKFVRSIVVYEKPLPWWRKQLMNIAYRSVKNYIYISHYIEKLYENDYPSLKKSYSRLIYNGAVNVKDNEINLEEKKTIVSTGGLCARKNMFVLLEAMNLIKKKYHRHDVNMIIIGDGPERQEMEQMQQRYNLEDAVELVGYTDKVADYLDECAIYVHPATTEGFGIAVVEAMQMSCACVVSNKGALPELVDNGKSGFVVDAYNAEEWADKILFLVDHPKQRIDFGKESCRRAKALFSLDAFIKNHDDYYDELMKR